MKTLRLGSRKSALAQKQAQWVADHVRQALPEWQVELDLMQTSGDQAFDPSHTGAKPALENPNLKALFTKELEEALLDQRIDIAVHSLKDMAAELPKGLVIGAVPLREDPRDVWISRTHLPFLNIANGTRIGTGSVRRLAQLKNLAPGADLLPIRGNVDTRLRKLTDGDYDGLILAYAGLIRLGKQNSVTEALSENMMVPAVGQGCLGIQVREKDSALDAVLAALDHPASRQAAIAERAFLKTLGGGCQTPIAAHATIRDSALSIIGLVISPDGSQEIRATVSGLVSEAEALGTALAQKLLKIGAAKILDAFSTPQ